MFKIQEGVDKNLIDSYNFVNDLIEMVHKFQIRTRTFQDLRKHLDKRGADIEGAIAMVKSGTGAASRKRKGGLTDDAADVQEQIEKEQSKKQAERS